MENPYRGSAVAARQFRSPLIAILLVASTVTLLLQDWVDATAILIVLESGEQVAADVRVINAHALQRQHQHQRQL